MPHHMSDLIEAIDSDNQRCIRPEKLRGVVLGPLNPVHHPMAIVESGNRVVQGQIPKTMQHRLIPKKRLDACLQLLWMKRFSKDINRSLEKRLWDRFSLRVLNQKNHRKDVRLEYSSQVTESLEPAGIGQVAGEQNQVVMVDRRRCDSIFARLGCRKLDPRVFQRLGKKSVAFRVGIDQQKPGRGRLIHYDQTMEQC